MLVTRQLTIASGCHQPVDAMVTIPTFAKIYYFVFNCKKKSINILHEMCNAQINFGVIIFRNNA